MEDLQKIKINYDKIIKLKESFLQEKSQFIQLQKER